MRIMADVLQLALRQRLLRAVGLTVLTVSGIYCVMAAYQTLTGGQFAGWSRTALTAGLVFAALACFGMTADANDYWMRGRKFTPEKARMMQSAILFSLVLSFLLSVFVVKTMLFLWLAPAIVIYVMLVARPTTAEAKAEAAKRQHRPVAASRSRPAAKRQRRGGRKHR